MKNLEKNSPVICFGQQPNGFFPKRFFIAKIKTAKNLQKEIGGKIILFYHDSDSDYRETITTLRDKQSGKLKRLNFEQENKLQKKYSPLYLKRIPKNWQDSMSRKLPQYVPQKLIEIFKNVKAKNVADFCLELYKKMGILNGIEIIRSSNSEVRKKASLTEKQDFFVDITYKDEVVRAQYRKDKKLLLHRGGGNYLEIEHNSFNSSQISPNAQQRLLWMQSIIHCTHYVMGSGEQQYMDQSQTPNVCFILRDTIDNHNEAWTNPLF